MKPNLYLIHKNKIMKKVLILILVLISCNRPRHISKSLEAHLKFNIYLDSVINYYQSGRIFEANRNIDSLLWYYSDYQRLYQFKNNESKAFSDSFQIAFYQFVNKVRKDYRAKGIYKEN